MLKSFSFMPKEIDIGFYYKVWGEIEKLKWYFYKFAGVNADEAMQRTLIHTLTHFQAEKGNLSAYIKKLAREITKESNRVIYVDFLEQTLADFDEVEEQQASIDTGRVNDFSIEVINNMMLSESKYNDVVCLALEFMDKFIMLCEALVRHDTSTKYYPESFIKQCLKINSKCSNFNQLCLEVFYKYEDDFRWFLDESVCIVPDWKEADFLMVENSTSKRVKFCELNSSKVVENADLEEFRLVGKLGENEQKKHIYKVRYYELWDYLCDLIDSYETNEIKFIIDDTYIIRTFGGSLTVINPDLYNVYDLLRMEIVTNILQYTNGRLLNIGSENIYLLCNPDFKPCTQVRNFNGFNYEFVFEDITSTIE